MIIVKLTILIVIVTIIYTWCVKNYLSGNLKEALLYRKNEYMPKYKIILILLRMFSAIGIFTSVIYLLFFR